MIHRFEIDFTDIFPIFHTSRPYYFIGCFIKRCHFLFCYKQTSVKGLEGRCVNCNIKDLYCGNLDVVNCPPRFDKHYELRIGLKWIKKLL